MPFALLSRKNGFVAPSVHCSSRMEFKVLQCTRKHIWFFFKWFLGFICCRKGWVAGLCLGRHSALLVRGIMSLMLSHCYVWSPMITLISTRSFTFYRLPIIWFLAMDFSENGIYTRFIDREINLCSLMLQLPGNGGWMDVWWYKKLT